MTDKAANKLELQRIKSVLKAFEKTRNKRLKSTTMGKIWVCDLAEGKAICSLVPYCNPLPSIWVYSLEVSEQEAGKGYGSRALRELCDWADFNNLVLRLYPSKFSHGRLADQVLDQWYERYDFTGCPYSDEGLDMIRFPNG